MITANKRGARARTKTPRKDKIVAAMLKVGWPKLLILSALLSIGLGLLYYYSYITPQSTTNEALNSELMQRRKQNAIARMVQETKPEFLQQFRRVITNYTTARELLPSEAEVSNVLDALQQMAKSNGVRITMFDASKPGAKSTNPAQTATAPPATPDAPQPAQPVQPQVSLNERVMPAQIQGPHAAVARFLSDVAKYPRIIYVRDFSITSLNHQESVNLTLVTYDAPTSGILPPIPSELRGELQAQGNRAARLNK